MSEVKKQTWILAVLLYLMMIVVMWKWGHQGDMMFWKDWSMYIYNNGLVNAYENPGCNYLPAYLYVLWLHTKIQGNLTDIQDNLYTLKYFTLLFDFAGAWLAVHWVKDDAKKLFSYLFLLLNVSFIYNTVLWGQVDAIFAFFGFLSVLLAIEKRMVFSALSLVIALNFKMQAIVFIPVTGLLLLPQIMAKSGFRKLMTAIFVAFIFQFALLLPFLMSGKLPQIWNVIAGAVDYYPYPTVGAFNMWSLLLPDVSIDGMFEINDSSVFGIASYKTIGRLMFLVMVTLALLPLAKEMWDLWLKKKQIYPVEKIMLVTALVCLNFYFFNTQMHERYVHPVMLPLAAYAFITGRYIPFVLVSVAYFLNMERICWYLHLHQETYLNSVIFKPRPIAGIYLIAILMMYYDLFRKNQTVILHQNTGNSGR